MSTDTQYIESNNAKRKSKLVLGRGLLLLFIILLFLLSLDLIGSSFYALRHSAAQSILAVTANPFVGLFIGLLLTAIIQSSSTSTAMVVALVGSGALSLSEAVPIVMGANIGTTLTSTLVSLGFITHRQEFKKAISAATVHDIFNILLTLILFPLEHYYNILSGTSAWLVEKFSSPFQGGEDIMYNPIGGVTNPVSGYIINLVDNNWILIFISFITLFATIKILSNLIYNLIIGKSQTKLDQFLFKNHLKSFGWGMGITAAVQSSSITTSLIVPLVATSKVTLQYAFPFILGANMGTTITALIAALFKSEAAMSIAITHFFFNLVGILIFLPFHKIRQIPIRLALSLGKLTMNNRIYGFLYIIIVFFLLPFVLIYFSR